MDNSSLRAKPVILNTDLHTHPLGDRYCHSPVGNLSREDLRDIAAYVEHLVARGVQVAACTDHDMLAGGLYARDLALERNLPVVIIPGCELSVMGKTQRLHLLAFNIERDLSSSKLTLREASREIHSQGGIAVLAHPVRYPQELNLDPDILSFLDGLETVNGLDGIYNTERLLDSDSRYDQKYIIQTAGSDEHWERGCSNPVIGTHTAPYYKVPAELLIKQGFTNPHLLNTLQPISK